MTGHLKIKPFQIYSGPWSAHGGFTAALSTDLSLIPMIEGAGPIKFYFKFYASTCWLSHKPPELR